MSTAIGDLTRKYKDRAILVEADLLSIIAQIQYTADVINVSKGRALTTVLGSITRKAADYTQMEIRDYISIINQIQINNDDIASIKGLTPTVVLGLLSRNCQNSIPPTITDFLSIVDQVQLHLDALIVIPAIAPTLVADASIYNFTGLDTGLLRSNPRFMPADTTSFLNTGIGVNLLYSGITAIVTSFSNPSYTHKVWRSGTQYSGTITLPSGYSNITWQLVRHPQSTNGVFPSQEVVASGSTTNVVATLNYITNDTVNVYDLCVQATRIGFQPVDKVFYGEVICLPALFTEGTADEVWDLTAGSVIKNGNFTDYSATGRKIWLKGTSSGTNVFNMFNWQNNNALKLIHVITSNATINTSNTGVQSCKFGGPLQNILIDGCSDETVQYGLKVNKIGTSSHTENIYITTDGVINNFIMCGFYVNNGTYTSGGSGCVVQMFNASTNNDNVYRLNRLTLFNSLVENCGAEGYYIAHTWDADTPPFAKIVHGLYIRCNSNHTSNEGWQWGGNIDSEILNSTWLDTGKSNVDGQRNAFVLRPGCQNVYMYGCTGISNYDITFLEPNVTGTNSEIFSNVFRSTNGAFVQGLLLRFAQSNVTGIEYQGIFNNIFRIATGAIGQLYNAPGSPPTTIMNLFFDSNLLITDTTNNYTLNNGFTIANSTINNKTILNVNTAGFINPAIDDYRPSSLAASMFGFAKTISTGTRIHPYANRDINGDTFASGANYAAGPYSGVDYMRGNAVIYNIASVASIADFPNVANGTSFATLTPQLQSTVLCTMSDGSTRTLGITWIQGSYDGNTANTYALNGNLQLPGDVTNSGSLQAHINVIVLAAAAPVSFKLGFGAGVSAGWTPITSNPVVGGTVDFGQIGTTGIGFKVLNSTGKLWTGTSGTSGGTGATIVPDVIQQELWYNAAANGGDIQLYETTPGSLTGRTFTLKFYGSRSGVTGTRTTQYSTQDGKSGSINVCPVNFVDNNSYVTLTGVTVSNATITMTIKYISPNDVNFGYINALEVNSE